MCRVAELYILVGMRDRCIDDEGRRREDRGGEMRKDRMASWECEVGVVSEEEVEDVVLDVGSVGGGGLAGDGHG